VARKSREWIARAHGVAACVLQAATKVALRAPRATRSTIAGVRRAVVQGFFNRLLSHFEPNIGFSQGMTPNRPPPVRQRQVSQCRLLLF
jgi:hypothetical protein